MLGCTCTVLLLTCSTLFCLQYGCLVVNAPTANTVAAAEHGIALMCALARNIAQADASMKQGKWERNKFVGASLVDKTLAIMGFGKVGLATHTCSNSFLARRAHSVSWCCGSAVNGRFLAASYCGFDELHMHQKPCPTAHLLLCRSVLCRLQGIHSWLCAVQVGSRIWSRRCHPWLHKQHIACADCVAMLMTLCGCSLLLSCAPSGRR